MKKALLSIVTIFVVLIISAGCIKNTPYVTTIDPSLTASISGGGNFTAKTVVPALVDTQLHDSVTFLQITANTSDLVYTNDKIILYVTKWKGQTGVFSIIQSQANALYQHGGTLDPAAGGIVAITKVTSNTIIGYFSFNTVSGVNVTNGQFTVGKPWNY